jgi:hypothetical protein
VSYQGATVDMAIVRTAPQLSAFAKGSAYRLVNLVIIDINYLDLIIIYVIDSVSHIFDGEVQLSPRGIVRAEFTPPVAENAPL